MIMFSNARRTMALTALGLLISAPVLAGPLGIGSGFKELLSGASDKSLDKLSQPGAFYADQAVRIVLPGTGGKLASKLMKVGDKAGLTKNLTKSLNDAAGLAAKEAKPVFRSAIDNLSLTDVPGLATQNDGATQYLKKSSGDQLRIKVRPLVQSALGKVGAFDQLGKLSSTGGVLGKLGLNNEKLTESVTDQTLKGIYGYMGSEEARLRKNPLKTGKSILDVLKK